MLTIAVIPPDESQPVFVKQIQGKLGDYQELVGGLIAFTDLERLPASIISNDEGLLEQLEYNHRATMFLWKHAWRHIGYTVLVGTCLVVGLPDEGGESTTIPPEVLAALGL